MKKPSKSFMALALVASLAAASFLLPGCGGTSAQAKDLAIKANDAAGKMNKVSTELTNNLQALFSQTSSGALPDPAKFEAGAKDLKALTAEIQKDVGEIRTQYESMKKLKGVDKYVQFADVQLQILDLTEKSIKEIDTFLDKVTSMIESGTLTQASFNQARDTLFSQVGSMNTTAQGLSDEAKKIREGNKLF